MLAPCGCTIAPNGRATISGPASPTRTCRPLAARGIRSDRDWRRGRTTVPCCASSSEPNGESPGLLPGGGRHWPGFSPVFGGGAVFFPPPPPPPSPPPLLGLPPPPPLGVPPP